MFVVSVVCCQVEISATGRSFVQRSSTECGVSECDRGTSIMRRPWPSGSRCTMVKRNNNNNNLFRMTDIDGGNIQKALYLASHCRSCIIIFNPYILCMHAPCFLHCK